MKEALLYEKLENKSIKCNLCAHYCLIKPGKRGICMVRENRDGTLYSLVYNKLISQAVDPIEKKPLYHFLPGTRSYSIATVGCNFQCEWCQNWQISQYPRLEDELPGKAVAPEEIVEAAIETNCATIAYTYTEPTIYFEYMLDTMRIASKHNLRNIIVSNGYFTDDALDKMAPFLHGANIDLKVMDDRIARKFTGGGVKPILENLKRMVGMGIWVEVTTMIIPGINDQADELEKIAEFIRNNLGDEIPWHVSRFFPHYKMQNVQPTSEETLKMAYKIGKDTGLKYIYFGNVGSGSDTYCPCCDTQIINRSGYAVRQPEIQNGKCNKCGEEIAGVWS